MNFNSEEILAKTITNQFAKTEINSLPFIVQEVKIFFLDHKNVYKILVSSYTRISSIHFA